MSPSWRRLLLLAVASMAFFLEQGLAFRPQHHRLHVAGKPPLLTMLATPDEQESPTATTSKSSSSSNIDLFAASNRKPPAPRPASPTPASASASAPATASTGAKSTTTTSPSPSPLLPGAFSQSKTALQAELLRLEAEAEQLVVDEQTFSKRKQKLVDIDRLLLQLIEKSVTLDDIITQNRPLVSKEMYFRIAELANNARTSEEKTQFTDMCANLLTTVKALDPVLHAELTADIEKELNADASKVGISDGLTRIVNRDGDSAKVYEQALQQWLRQTNSSTININGTDTPVTQNFVFPQPFTPGVFSGENNNSSSSNTNVFGMGGGQPKALRFPSALPFNLLPLMLRSPEISELDIKVIQETVFTSDILENPILDYGVFLATFRGKPCVSPAETLRMARYRIDNIPGLKDTLRVLVLPEYRLTSPQQAGGNNTMLERYSGVKFEPVFVILNKAAEPKLAGIEYPAIAAALLASLVTSFIYATDVNSLNAGFVERALAGDDSVVDRVFSIIGGLLMLQAVHELGHRVMAAVHGVKIGVPFILPSLQIGSFGGITRYLSFPRSRKAAFDVAIAGPLLGFGASLAVLLSGLSETVSATPDALAQFPALPTGFFQTSWLLYALLDNYIHIAEAAKVATSLTPVHPFVVIGATGLLVNAYNFLPIGRLDGGRVVMAVGGRQTSNSVSFGALVGCAFSLLSSASPVLFFWLLSVVFLQRGADLPPEDDVTPVGEGEPNVIVWGGRLAALVFCLGLTAALILPIPIDIDSSAAAATAIGGGASTLFDGPSKLI